MDPLETISTRRRILLFWSLLAATLLVMAILQLDGQVLKNEQAPFGIVSYELTGSVTGAQAILVSWDPNARIHAAFNLGLDYLFMPLYAATIGLGCLWAAEIWRVRKRQIGYLGTWLVWALWLAAAFDAVENIALLRMLYTQAISP